MACGLMRAHSDAPRRRCRHVLFLAGCPSSKNPTTTTETDGGTDAGSGAPSCPIVPTCTATIRYAGTGTSVSLRGDFAPDGWTTGVAMMQVDGGWDATVPANDQQVIVYKFVVDGTWIADPENPRKTPDGYGAFNSVMRVDCDHCPAARRDRLARRDHVLRDDRSVRRRRPEQRRDRRRRRAPGQYQGGDFAGVHAEDRRRLLRSTSASTRCGSPSPLDNADNANPGADGHDYSGYHGYWPTDLTTVESQLRHRGRAQGDGRRRARARHPGADRLRDEPRARRPRRCTRSTPTGSGPTTTATAATACAAPAAAGTPIARAAGSTLPARLQLPRTATRAAGRSSNAVAWAKRIGIDGFRLDAVKHIETRGSPTCARGSIAEIALGPALLHGRRDVRRQPRPHQVVRQPRHDARRPVRLPAARPGAVDAARAATAR